MIVGKFGELCFWPMRSHLDRYSGQEEKEDRCPLRVHAYHIWTPSVPTHVRFTRPTISRYLLLVLCITSIVNTMKFGRKISVSFIEIGLPCDIILITLARTDRPV